MYKHLVLSVLTLLFFACGDGGGANGNTSSSDGSSSANEASSENPAYDPERGAGKFTQVDVGEKLDLAKAEAGKKSFDLKCSSCHKLTDEKLVGPGWKGVSQRHQPEWIMNFITNVDEMLAKDPKAQAQLEICLVRMPNQNLSDDEARNLLEFMRQNDGIK